MLLSSPVERSKRDNMIIRHRIFVFFFAILAFSGVVAESKGQVKERPNIEIDLLGCNRTFYFEGVPIQYVVRLTDPKDGSVLNQKVSPDQLVFSVQYMREGYDSRKNLPRDNRPVTSMPLEGTYTPPARSRDGEVVLRATFKDRAGNEIVEETLVLRKSKIEVAAGNASRGVRSFSTRGRATQQTWVYASGSYVQFPAIDMTGLAGVRIMASTPEGQTKKEEGRGRRD